MPLEASLRGSLSGFLYKGSASDWAFGCCFFFFFGGGGGWGGLGSWGFRVSAFGFIVKGCRAQGGAEQPRPLDSSLLSVAASLPYKMKRNLTKPFLKNSPKP